MIDLLDNDERFIAQLRVGWMVRLRKKTRQGKGGGEGCRGDGEVTEGEGQGHRSNVHRYSFVTCGRWGEGRIGEDGRVRRWDGSTQG